MNNFERAQSGLEMIKEAILAELRKFPVGLRNVEIVQKLGLKSDFKGNHSSYLSYSILGLLISEGKVAYKGSGRQGRFHNQP